MFDLNVRERSFPLKTLERSGAPLPFVEDVHPIQINESPPRSSLLPISERISIRISNVINLQEATLRKTITPKIEIDQEAMNIRLVSQGLLLTEERRVVGVEAILIEVAARYRRGAGSIKQIYRYLVFSENGKAYCQRLPMGSWPPIGADECLEWLGRGGLQQGDFVLLPRKRLPEDVVEIPRPKQVNILEKTASAIQTFFREAFLDDSIEQPEWERTIGRHNPVDCRLLSHSASGRYYLVAPHDTVSNHPEHAQLKVPEGMYEIVEDRASAFWRNAID